MKIHRGEQQPCRVFQNLEPRKRMVETAITFGIRAIHWYSPCWDKARSPVVSMCPPRVKLWLTHLPNVLQNDASKSKPVGSLPAARPVVASPGFAQVSKNVGKTPQISDAFCWCKEKNSKKPTGKVEGLEIRCSPFSCLCALQLMFLGGRGGFWVCFQF